MFMRAATITAVRHPQELSGLKPYADCEDSLNYLNALLTLMEQTGDTVSSSSRRQRGGAFPITIDIGAGAAPARFFTALAAAIPGSDIVLKGSDQLRMRPITPLVELLRKAGADIEFLEGEFSLPLHIRGKQLDATHISSTDVESTKTSQYLSAMILTSPLTGFPTDIIELSDTVSSSYISMTLRMMKEDSPSIEYDWSAASFFYEAAMVLTFHDIALAEEPLALPPLLPPGMSLQGDSLCSEIFAGLGVTTVFNDDRTLLFVNPEAVRQRANSNVALEYDMNSTPDLVPPVAAALTFCGIPFRITGISHLQYKESRRMHTISHEMRKLGYDVQYTDDSLSFSGGVIPFTPKIHYTDTYADHRLVMAFAPLIHRPGIRVLDYDSVSKSFPRFWEEFLNLNKK